MANVSVARRIASTYCFCPRVFGEMPRPRPVRSTSPSTSVGLAWFPLMSSIDRPTEDAVRSCPRSSSESNSSKSTPTRSASSWGPVMVISFPRTTITESNAASTSLSNSSRCPRRATIDWSPGTKIFTWVVALAKVRSSEGGPPFLPVGGLLVDRCKRGRHPTTPAEGDCTVGLPGRPRHLPPSQQVEVEVVHRLPSVGPSVGHETPSGAVHALDPGELHRRLDHLHEHVGVTIADLLHGPKVLLWHDQDVRGCLGIDVPKGHHV